MAPGRHNCLKGLPLRGHFHVLDLCLKISDKGKGRVAGYSDPARVLWANSSASLLPFLPPKASYSAPSSWRSVTITLIETGFLKVTSQALYLTSLPTFSTAFDTFDNSLPPSCHTTTPPHTHAHTSWKFSPPASCRFLWNPSTTSVFFSRSYSHRSSSNSLKHM